MSAVIKDLLRQFSKVGSEAYLLPPSQFMIVGVEILVLGTAPFKVSKADLQSSSSSVNGAISDRAIRQLFVRMRKLRTRAIGSFSVSKLYVKRLTSLAAELDSTHVRFFNDEKRGIVGRLFDVRVGSDLLLPRNKRIHSAATLETNATTEAMFSFTLSVEALKQLPSDDLLLTVYQDGILEVEPVNVRFAESYLCRDQGIMESFTSFQHDVLKRTVYFVHHPSH